MGTTAEGLGDKKAWSTAGETFPPASPRCSVRPQRLEALRVTIAFGQDGRRIPEGNQDRTGQVPRYHAGEDGPLPYVPTQEPFGPTTTSSST